MATDLSHHIQDIVVVDTHEHLHKEPQWRGDESVDVLSDLFQTYVPEDLITAGATRAAVDRLLDGSDADIDGRWGNVSEAWDTVQFTGYGQAVRFQARHVYGIEDITPQTLRSAQDKLSELRQPGARLHLLRNVAKLDHVQTDDFLWNCDPDPSGPEFFLYDLSWADFIGRGIKCEQLADETGISVSNIAQLRQAMAAVFETHGPTAIAVKSQHAYRRTLKWEKHNDEDAERALQHILKTPEDFPNSPAGRCLGDWCWARGVELAIEYKLPFKIHTGYYAGNGDMPINRIPAGHMCDLLMQYPDARFVMMHIAYPYHEELIAMAKHFPNVYVDLCWAWSINPFASADFAVAFCTRCRSTSCSVLVVTPRIPPAPTRIPFKCDDGSRRDCKLRWMMAS